MQEKTVSIPSIHCEHCARTIKNELTDLEGVQSVDVDVAARKATIRWSEPADWDEIENVLEEIEYPVEE